MFPSARPFDVLVGRADGVRGAPPKVRARCANCGKSGCLSIAEGSDGTCIIHCFRGCTASEIVGSYGLTLRDLFPHFPRAEFRRRERRPRQLAASEIEREVADRLERILTQEEATIGFRPTVLSRHVAEARRRAGDRLGIKLKPPIPVWFEVEPHATDPLWKMLVDRAIEERAWACNVDVAIVARSCARNPRVADSVLADAARMLREGASCTTMS